MFKDLIFIIILLLALLWIMAFLPNARADLTENSFSLYLINDTQEKQIYSVYWFDHDWGEEFPKSLLRATGRLDQGKSTLLESEYKPGIYGVIWNPVYGKFKASETLVLFTIYPGTQKVIVTTKKYFIEKDSSNDHL